MKFSRLTQGIHCSNYVLPFSFLISLLHIFWYSSHQYIAIIDLNNFIAIEPYFSVHYTHSRPRNGIGRLSNIIL